MKNKAAVYVRVSTADKGQDTENQLVQLKEYCAGMNIEIFQVYKDNFSGAKGRNERAGFDQMFKDASQGKFNLVIFWALDRFTREGVYMTMTYLKQLDGYGVKFRSYSEPYLNTMDNELASNILITILSHFAELERKKISERTKAGMARAKAAGKKVGNKSLDPEIINKIHQLQDKCLGASEIARRLKISLSSVKKYRKPQLLDISKVNRKKGKNAA